MQKHLTDATEERDSPNNEYENLKEETKLKLFQKFQEKFYNGPGILDAKDLQKISKEAGKDLEMKYFERYGNIIQEAVELGLPVTAGTYIMTKPTMKLVPVRINVDSDKREDRLFTMGEEARKDVKFYLIFLKFFSILASTM